MNQFAAATPTGSRNLLFIPAYNCSAQIQRVLSRLSANDLKHFDEVLIIDNGSEDKTLQAAQSTLADSSKPISAKKVTLVQNHKNYGLGGSHKVAFDYCLKNNFDFCTVLHGDDQARLADFSRFLVSQQYNSTDLFLGARFMPGSKRINYSFLRTAGNVTLNILSHLVSKVKIYDLGGSGLNIFRIATLPKGFDSYYNFPNDMTFHVHLLLWSIQNGLRIRFVPIQWVEEDQVSNVHVFKQGFQVLGILMSNLVSDLKRPRKLSSAKYTYSVVQKLNHETN